MKRYHDAYAIIQGACNPSGICHAIMNACREICIQPDHTGTAQITSDPAVRLMVYQLAFICKAYEFDNSHGAYDEAMAAVKREVDKLG